MNIYEKEFCDEDLCDLEEEVGLAVSDFNPLLKDVEVDEHGLRKGIFKVTIEYIKE